LLCTPCCTDMRTVQANLWPSQLLVIERLLFTIHLTQLPSACLYSPHCWFILWWLDQQVVPHQTNCCASAAALPAELAQ
jgi:hypothetical protein